MPVIVPLLKLGSLFKVLFIATFLFSFFFKDRMADITLKLLSIPFPELTGDWTVIGGMVDLKHVNALIPLKELFVSFALIGATAARVYTIKWTWRGIKAINTLNA